MRQDKRRVPVDHSPRKSGSQPFLVFSRNPHWKHSAAILRKVDFAIPIMKKGSEDKPHASFFLWKRFLCHICEGFNGSTGMLTCEPVAELQQKNPEHTGLWGKSFGRTGRYLFATRDFASQPWLNSFPRCKDTT